MSLVLAVITFEVSRTKPRAYLRDGFFFLRNDIGFILLENITTVNDNGVCPPESHPVHVVYSGWQNSLDGSVLLCGCLILS